MTTTTVDNFANLNANRSSIIHAVNEDLKVINNLLNSIDLVESAGCSVLSTDFKEFVEECKHNLRHLAGMKFFEENNNFRLPEDEDAFGFGFWVYSVVDDNSFQWFPLWEKLLANTKRELNKAGVSIFGNLNNMGCDPGEI
jgi:hypothetical protein